MCGEDCCPSTNPAPGLRRAATACIAFSILGGVVAPSALVCLIVGLTVQNGDTSALVRDFACIKCVAILGIVLVSIEWGVGLIAAAWMLAVVSMVCAIFGRRRLEEEGEEAKAAAKAEEASMPPPRASGAAAALNALLEDEDAIALPAAPILSAAFKRLLAPLLIASIRGAAVGMVNVPPPLQQQQQPGVAAIRRSTAAVGGAPAALFPTAAAAAADAPPRRRRSLYHGPDPTTVLAANDDACRYAANGVCEDGGVNASFAYCPCGTDATDCGDRTAAACDGQGWWEGTYRDDEWGCGRWANDDICDDGGPGSEYQPEPGNAYAYSCPCGSDVIDCGFRRPDECPTPSPYAPPKPPAAPPPPARPPAPPFPPNIPYSTFYGGSGGYDPCAAFRITVFVVGSLLSIGFCGQLISLILLIVRAGQVVKQHIGAEAGAEVASGGVQMPAVGVAAMAVSSAAPDDAVQPVAAAPIAYGQRIGHPQTIA